MKDDDLFHPKLMTLPDFLAMRRVLPKGYRLVFTNGCFDVFHAGHASLLDWCKTQGEIVVVGINSDDSVRGLKGSGRPIMPQEQRARIVASHRAVDFVVG